MLGDAPLEYRRDGLVITTDLRRIDPDSALELLRTTSWAREMKPSRSSCIAATNSGRHRARSRSSLRRRNSP